MKNKITLILAIVFGLLGSYFVYDYLHGVEKSLNNIQYEKVIVANRDIGPKMIVTEAMLEQKAVAIEYIHPEALRKFEDIAGSVTLGPIVKGEQIMVKKLARPGDGKNGLAYLIPQGKRAITVPVDDVSGIAGLIKPGDHIDVLATVNIPNGAQETAFSLVVLQDITVLAVGRDMDTRGDNKAPAENKTITLAVTVEQSRPLVLASQKGVIRLALRSPVDTGTQFTIPFKSLDFMN